MLATESLWLGNAEGVRVTFDTERVTFAQLLERATKTGCDRAIWTTTDAQLRLAKAAVGDRAAPERGLVGERTPRRDKEQQYYLLQTALKHVPMTRVQATRANAAVRKGDLTQAHLGRFLSPRQLDWLSRVEAAPKRRWPIACGVPMAEAVAAFGRVASGAGR